MLAHLANSPTLCVPILLKRLLRGASLLQAFSRMFAARSEIVHRARQGGISRLNLGFSHGLIHDIALMRGARLLDGLVQLRDNRFYLKCPVEDVVSHAPLANRPRIDENDLVGFFPAKIADHDHCQAGSPRRTTFHLTS